eukprot:gene4866-7506_t
MSARRPSEQRDAAAPRASDAARAGSWSVASPFPPDSGGREPAGLLRDADQEAVIEALQAELDAKCREIRVLTVEKRAAERRLAAEPRHPVGHLDRLAELQRELTAVTDERDRLRVLTSEQNEGFRIQLEGIYEALLSGGGSGDGAVPLDLISAVRSLDQAVQGCGLDEKLADAAREADAKIEEN